MLNTLIAVLLSQVIQLAPLPPRPTRVVTSLLLAAVLVSPPLAVSRPQSPSGTLVIAIKGRVRYTEGAYVHFTIRSMNGVVTEFEFITANEENSKTLRLPPGDYELQTYVRPRSGGPSPGPPQDQCAGAFTLKDGETLYVNRVQTEGPPGGREGGPCNVEFSGPSGRR